MFILIGVGGACLAGYLLGRAQGYALYEKIEKESKIWVMK